MSIMPVGPNELVDLNDLHVMSDTLGVELHLCSVTLYSLRTRTKIHHLREDDYEVIAGYDEFPEGKYVCEQREPVGGLATHSFKTLLQKYGIAQEFGIQNKDYVHIKEVGTLWEWLENAMMLEFCENQLATLEAKKQEMLDKQKVLRKQREDFVSQKTKN